MALNKIINKKVQRTSNRINYEKLIIGILMSINSGDYQKARNMLPIKRPDGRFKQPGTEMIVAKETAIECLTAYDLADYIYNNGQMLPLSLIVARINPIYDPIKSNAGYHAKNGRFMKKEDARNQIILRNLLNKIAPIFIKSAITIIL